MNGEHGPAIPPRESGEGQRGQERGDESEALVKVLFLQTPPASLPGSLSSSDTASLISSTPVTKRSFRTP